MIRNDLNAFHAMACAGLRPWAHWAALALTAGSTRLSQVIVLRTGKISRLASQADENYSH